MRKLKGTIVSNAMSKTVVVRVDRLRTHRKYHKHVVTSKKYHAHDEEGGHRIGDMVFIEQTRPLSRLKRWRVAGLVSMHSEKGEGSTVEEAAVPEEKTQSEA